MWRAPPGRRGPAGRPAAPRAAGSVRPRPPRNRRAASRCRRCDAASLRGRAMSEAEWLAATDPTPMLEYVQQAGSVRRLRLFSCACLRQLEDIPWELEKAVEYSERGVDSLLRHDEVASRIRRLAFQMNVRDQYELPW